MGPIEQAMSHVRDRLRAAEIRAAMDPADANLPGAILFPDTVDYERLDGVTPVLSVTVVLVATGGRQLDAVRQLDAMLDKARQAFPGELGSLQAVTVNLPNHSADPIPAMRTSVLLSITE